MPEEQEQSGGDCGQQDSDQSNQQQQTERVLEDPILDYLRKSGDDPPKKK